MKRPFLSIPSFQEVAHTAFYCLLVLSLPLTLVSLAGARFGPLRGTAVSLYPLMDRAVYGAVQIAGLGSVIGFGLALRACPRLRWRKLWLCLFVFMLAALAFG